MFSSKAAPSCSAMSRLGLLGKANDIMQLYDAVPPATHKNFPVGSLIPKSSWNSLKAFNVDAKAAKAFLSCPIASMSLSNVRLCCLALPHGVRQAFQDISKFFEASHNVTGILLFKTTSAPCVFRQVRPTIEQGGTPPSLFLISMRGDQQRNHMYGVRSFPA